MDLVEKAVDHYNATIARALGTCGDNALYSKIKKVDMEKPIQKGKGISKEKGILIQKDLGKEVDFKITQKAKAKEKDQKAAVTTVGETITNVTVRKTVEKEAKGI